MARFSRSLYRLSIALKMEKMARPEFLDFFAMIGGVDKA